MSSNFRVRCAPSPTSKAGLHLGNVKTFIFNYLFAKKNNCSFILRIEDSDVARNNENGPEHILRDLTWLGLLPNMGYGTSNKPAEFYKQSERLHIYQEYANKLLQEGKAYKCYCSQEELDKKRVEALAKNPKQPFKYPGTCANLKEDLGKDFIVRLKTPKDGFTEINDIAFGKRMMPNKENYDFAIMRSSGLALFGFANTVDDGIIDRITHVIRGSDHYSNTLQHVLIYQALGITPPTFCHLPLLRNKENAKLSKRDGSVALSEYRSMGYSPDAIINYLVKFGWGHKDKEIFSLTELIELFDINNCHNRDGKFDSVKFATINYEHLKSSALTPDDTYAKLLKPFIDAKQIGDFTEEQIKPFISVVRSRAKTFIEAADLMAPMLRDELIISSELLLKTFNEHNSSHLTHLTDMFASLDSWNEEVLRSNTQSWLKEKELSLKDIGAPLRTALLGTTNSPELFGVMNALGREKSIARLNYTIHQLSQINGYK